METPNIGTEKIKIAIPHANSSAVTSGTRWPPRVLKRAPRRAVSTSNHYRCLENVQNPSVCRVRCDLHHDKQTFFRGTLAKLMKWNSRRS